MPAAPAALLKHLSAATLTDGECLRRYACDRDEAAFAEVVRRNGPLVLRAGRGSWLEVPRRGHTADHYDVEILTGCDRGGGTGTGRATTEGLGHDIAGPDSDDRQGS